MKQKRKFINKKTGHIVKTRCSYLVLFNKYSILRGFIDKDIVIQGDDWKEITEPELIKGQWYKDTYENIGRWDGEKTSEGKLIFKDIYNPDYDIVRKTMIGDSDITWEEANIYEIHHAIDAILSKKGIVEGVKVKSPSSGKEFVFYRRTHYNESNDILIDEDSEEDIYNKGKWVSKVEEPIIITEDGYKLFEGQEYYFIDRWFSIRCITAKLIGLTEDAKRFKYKENALDYIEQYKPRFSRADLDNIEKVCDRAYNIPETMVIKRLIYKLKVEK